MASPIGSITSGVSSLLNSLLSVFSSFTLSISDGFLTLPITQIRAGAALTDMLNAIHYPDSSGNYQLGQSYGTSNTLAGPSYQQAPPYQPGQTDPPKAFPTSQPNGYQVPLGVNPVSMYRLSAEALRVLKVFEGLHQRPHVIGDKTYIGYGRLIDNKANPSQYVSMDEAESMLQADVQAAEGMVKGAISAQLTQGQFDAMVDLAYTTTAAKFKSSAVVQKINGGDIPGAITALAQFCYTMQDNAVSRSLHLTSRRIHNIHWMSMPILPLPPS